eukprot:995896-Prymnesium_polylepis.1
MRARWGRPHQSCALPGDTLQRVGRRLVNARGPASPVISASRAAPATCQAPYGASTNALRCFERVPSPSTAEGTYNPTPGGTSEQACLKCEPGQDSVRGSARCTVCAADFYRPTSDSSVDECTKCSAVRGVSCAADTTIETLNLTSGYWRHSSATKQTHLCKSDGSWTPCIGGHAAGAHGDGYCAPGYRGPRCELCAGT